MNHLYLVRHGENPANLSKEFSHRVVDYSLTPKGVVQAQQTAEFLLGKSIDEVYSSPLKRASETAEIIADRLGLPVVILEDLRETNVGELEIRPPTDSNWILHNQILGDWFDGKPEIAFPGGENYFSLLARARSALTRMIDGKDGRHIVAVGHGGMFTVTLKDLCQNVDSQWLRLQQTHNCSITEVLIEQQEGLLRGRLVAWAAYDHLHGIASEFVPGIPLWGARVGRK